MLTNILVLTIPFIFVIAITWLKNTEKQKRRQLQADLYLKALEKGHTVPEALLQDEKKWEDKPLNNGIILVAISIGIWIMLEFIFSGLAWTSSNSTINPLYQSIPWVSIVPFMVGVAFIIIHFIEKKKKENGNAQ